MLITSKCVLTPLLISHVSYIVVTCNLCWCPLCPVWLFLASCGVVHFFPYYFPLCCCPLFTVLLSFVSSVVIHCLLCCCPFCHVRLFIVSYLVVPCVQFNRCLLYQVFNCQETGQCLQRAGIMGHLCLDRKYKVDLY